MLLIGKFRVEIPEVSFTFTLMSIITVIRIRKPYGFRRKLLML